MSLSVEEILRLPGLESLALRAGARNLHRSVRWSYVAENVGIADWVMGGELVFVTGINHSRDEANLLQLVREGVASGIAGIVILTGDEFIQRIPESVVHLAEVEGLPLIEQPYALKMVIVTHLIGTALVQMTQVKTSRRDILGQLLSGDFPSLEIVRRRAQHLELPLEARGAWWRSGCPASTDYSSSTNRKRPSAHCSSPASACSTIWKAGSRSAPSACRW